MIVDPRVAGRKFDLDVAPIKDDPALFTEQGMRLVEARFPILRVALLWPAQRLEIPIQLSAPDWDYRPASVGWVSEDGGNWTGPFPTSNGFQGPHPQTGRPWLCFPGTLEFHEWESHLAQAWWPIHLDPQYRLLGFVQHIAAVLRRTSQ